MYKRVIAMCLLIATLFSLTACSDFKAKGRETVINMSQDVAERKLKNHLKEKYPDKTFKITVSNESIMDNFEITIEGASKLFSSSFNIVDENGNEYKAIVNTLGLAEDELFSVIDTVQKKEIEEAMKNKLCKIFNTEETETDFWVISYLLEYAEAKFDGDIDKFIKEDNFLNLLISYGNNISSNYIVKNAPFFYATYVYNDNTPEFNTINEQESIDTLKRFAQVSFYKFKTNVINRESADKYTLSENYGIMATNLMHISDCHIIPSLEYGKELEVEHKPPCIIQDQELYYTKIFRDFDSLDLRTEYQPDLSEWETEINEYQKENGEIWKSYDVVYGSYKAEGGYNYFLEKPTTNKTNVEYKIFAISKDTKKIITIYDKPTFDSEERIDNMLISRCCINNGFIFVSYLEVTDDVTWFIVECEVESQK